MDCRFVIPVTHEDLVDLVLENYDVDPGRLLLVDNSPESVCKKHEARGFRVAYHPHNLGVAASWNLGVKTLREGEMLWIISQSMFFPKGWSVLTKVAESASAWGINTHHGWKLMGLTKKSFDVVGLFDENYYPAYFEELDWLRRRDLWNVRYEGRMQYPHGFVLAGVWGNNIAVYRQQVGQVPWDPQYHGRKYYIAKWGGNGPDEKFIVPFNGKPPSCIPPREGAACLPGVCS